MDHNLSPLERAFQLARSSECRTVSDIKKRMKLEGYSIAQVEGQSLRKQLRALIIAAAPKTERPRKIEET
jgi:hypothetical protein